MAHNLPVVPAAFLSVAGVIKYGERIWALKCGSQESLKSSISSSYVAALKKLAHDEEDGIQSLDAQLTFKTAEMELSMMYDELYTKAKVIQTGKGTILRCVSLTSTVVAFVLFILMSGSKQRYYNSIGVDVAITYMLFVGAFCLEACAIIIAMVSPRAWASMEARGGGCNSSLLTRATCRSSCSSMLPSIHPEKRLWWSNSLGQYNFMSSRLADGKSRITEEMMAIVGAKEPAMLPVQRNVYDLLALVLNDAGYARTSSKEQFLETVASGEYSWDQPFMDFRAAPPDDMLQQGWKGLHAALQVMLQIWVRLLIYAAGKSQHARRLSMGGELLTFVWLLMAHRELGDIYNIQFQLVEKEKDGSVRTGPNSTITTDIYTLFRLGHPIDMIK
ncbi:hypothetical protein OsJ_18366 [Oryza sativa Japonica Group]|uniref:DUF4220 domain-containing protein n=1 Tax=Oryza sativa subsp. japonica TaxID=39947 RepID=B9FPB9_ORYSJ|nr:hypothetical protein OsJ_18366 [Oryza sativa Japonica Group]